MGQLPEVREARIHARVQATPAEERAGADDEPNRKNSLTPPQTMSYYPLEKIQTQPRRSPTGELEIPSPERGALDQNIEDGPNRL